MSSGHEILRYGLATPFVQFNFATGETIEAKPHPKHFVSLEHDRTCTKACTFKLTVIYVPDTFSPGEPTKIDAMLINSVRQRVTYQYGYYDYLGARHVQQQEYVGQVYTYNSDTNIANGTITYTIEGTSHVAQITNMYAEIKGQTEPIQPSVYLHNCFSQSKGNSDGFAVLKNTYNITDWSHTDMKVPIPNIGRAPVMDLILGTSNNITKNNGNIAKVGGLVNYSVAPLQKTMEEFHNAGYINQTTYDAYQKGGLSPEQSKNMLDQTRIKLGTPFICYIDDISVGGKYGTFHYVPKTRYTNKSDATFYFDYGNHFRDSDVLSFSVDYDGSVALAAASATDDVKASVDAEGNPVGASNDFGKTNNLSSNTVPTMAGFKEGMFTSIKDLSNLMVYQFEATMTVMGQIQPNQLLDIIYVVVSLNGANVPHLTGEYQILEVTDSISESGFTTTFRLVRYVPDKEASNLMETAVSTSTKSNAQDTQDAIDKTDNRNKQSTGSQVPNI